MTEPLVGIVRQPHERNIKMQKFWTTAALALAAGAANASGGATTVISFDGLDDTPTLFAHGDEFTQSGYWFDPFSNQAGPHSGPNGDLVGALVDGSHLADTCLGIACPTGNASSFYTGLNDGVLAMGRLDGALFRLSGLDLGFVGAVSGASLPNNTPLVMQLQGVKADNSTVTSSLTLPPPVNGGFQFYQLASDAAFQATAFKEVYFYGLPCDASGHCSGFVSNKGQFALDNINTLAVTAVPEPGQWLLMTLGLGAMVGFMRRRTA